MGRTLVAVRAPGQAAEALAVPARVSRTIGGGLTATLPVAAGAVPQLNVGQGWPRGRF